MGDLPFRAAAIEALEGDAYALAVAPSGALAAVLGSRGAVGLFGLDPLARLHTWRAGFEPSYRSHPGGRLDRDHNSDTGVAFSPDGSRLLAWDGRTTIAWDTALGDEVLRAAGGLRSWTCGGTVAVTAQRRAGGGRQLALFSVVDGGEVGAWSVPKKGHLYDVFPRGDRQLLVTRTDGVLLVDPDHAEPLASWEGLCLRAVSPDGRCGFGLGADDALRVLDLDRPGEAPRRLEASSGGAVWVRGDRFVTFAYYGRAIRVWDTGSWTVVHALEEPLEDTHLLGAVALDDGRRFVTVHASGVRATVWDADSGAAVPLAGPVPRTGHTRLRIAAHPLGALGVSDSELLLWDPDDGRLLGTQRLRHGFNDFEVARSGRVVVGVAAGPNVYARGDLVVLTPEPRPARPATAAPAAVRPTRELAEASVQLHRAPITAIALGARLATMDETDRLRITSLGTMEDASTVQVPFRCERLDLAGERLVVAGEGFFQIYDLATAALLVESVGRVMLLDGGRLVTGDSNGIEIWTLASADTSGRIALPSGKARVHYHPAMDDMTAEEIDAHTPAAMINRVMTAGPGRIAVSTDEPMVHLIDAERGEVIRSFRRNPLLVHPDGRTAFDVPYRDRALYAFELEDPDTEGVYMQHAVETYGSGQVAFLSDGRTATTIDRHDHLGDWRGVADTRSELRIWSPGTWACERVIEELHGRHHVLALASLGAATLVTAAAAELGPRLWNADTGGGRALGATPRSGAERTVSLHVAAGLIIAVTTHAVRWWDPADAALLAEHALAGPAPHAIHVAADARVAYGDAAGTVHLLDPAGR